MEIERKFLVKILPDLNACSSRQITQAYISTDPVIRIRQMDELYFLTVKSKGSIMREEFEMPLTKDQFENLLPKSEVSPIKKRRYFIPLTENHTAELDIYFDKLEGLVTVEVEFASIEEADHFMPPDWFGKDISFDQRYKNNNLARYGLPSAKPHL